MLPNIATQLANFGFKANDNLWCLLTNIYKYGKKIGKRLPNITTSLDSISGSSFHSLLPKITSSLLAGVE